MNSAEKQSRQSVLRSCRAKLVTFSQEEKHRKSEPYQNFLDILAEMEAEAEQESGVVFTASNAAERYTVLEMCHELYTGEKRAISQNFAFQSPRQRFETSFYHISDTIDAIKAVMREARQHMEAASPKRKRGA